MNNQQERKEEREGTRKKGMEGLGLAWGKEREDKEGSGLCTEEFQLINEGMKQIEKSSLKYHSNSCYNLYPLSGC